MSMTLRLALTLAVTWLLFSGLLKAQLILLGLASVVLVTWLSKRMEFDRHRGRPLYFRLGRLVRYLGWLVREIFLSNVAVTRRVLARRMDIKPGLCPVSAMPTTDLGEVLYANSITLTPGTTAINFTPDGRVLVHALHAKSLAELEEGSMVREILRVEPDFQPPASLRYRCLSW